MENMIIKNGTVVINDSLQMVDIEIKDGKIFNIGTNLDEKDLNVIDAKSMFVLPGFIEIHTHGGNNFDMNLVQLDQIGDLSNFYVKNGVTGFCPTILTDTSETLIECMEKFSKAMDDQLDVGSRILGMHLEGPYLSKEYKGAMPEYLLKTPCIDDFMQYQKAAKGNIKIITMAPELDNAMPFINEVFKTGVVVSMGHSGAEYETAIEAIENGASSCTHLYNATKLTHQHFPSLTGAVLESDIYSEVISDGIHVHPANIRILLKAKGFDKVIAITDSISAAGLPDGEYKLGVNDVVVINGDAKLKDRDMRAGSTLTSDRCFRNLVKFTNEPINKISKLMSANPAKLLNIFDKKGSIECGKDGDIVIMNNDGFVQYCIVEGKLCFSNNS